MRFADFQKSSHALLPSFIHNCPESHHTLNHLHTPPLSTLQLPSELRSSSLPSLSFSWSRTRVITQEEAQERKEASHREENTIFRLCLRTKSFSEVTTGQAEGIKPLSITVLLSDQEKTNILKILLRGSKHKKQPKDLNRVRQLE